MRMLAPWIYNLSPRGRYSFVNSPPYGNMGSITDPKLSIAAHAGDRISWKKENCNGQTQPSSSHFQRISPVPLTTSGYSYSLRNIFTGYNFARNSPSHTDPSARSPLHGEP